MALISDTPYEKHGGTDNPRDSLNFTPETHYVAAADAPKGGDPQHAKEEAGELTGNDSENSAHARHGASIAFGGTAVKGDSMAFTSTVGLFTPGSAVGDCFESAIRDSGGVRQGHAWTSDVAPGAHRAQGIEHTVSLSDLQKPDEADKEFNGSGRTFESQRRARWVS